MENNTNKNKKDSDIFLRTIWLVLGGLILISVICIFKCDSSDRATMISGALSAFATAALGSIAIWQNMRYKKQSDENAKRIEVLTRTPEIFFVKQVNKVLQDVPYEIITHEDDLSGKCDELYLLFSTAQHPVRQIMIEELTLSVLPDDDDSLVRKNFYYNIKLPYIKEQSNFLLGITIPDKYKNRPYEMSVIIRYCNIYNEKTIKKLTFRNKISNNSLSLYDCSMAYIVD